MNLSYTRDDLRLTFFSPFSNLCVDLVSELGFDLACITGEESEKTLCATVDNIYLMQRYRVHYLSAFLNFALRALDEFCLYWFDQSK
jgi:hypothetical protein